jgi:sugar/nucleoside kinase (ribokinase family)
VNRPLGPRGGVLVSGNAVFDILVRPVDRLVWGTSTWVESIEQHMGGNGSNTSFALAKLGTPVRLLTWLGGDAYGDQLFEKLTGAGVDTRFVQRAATAATAITVALVQSGGNRLFLHRPGVSAEAFPEPIEFTPELLDGISHYHLANPFALPRKRAHAAECLRRARAAGLTSSLDLAWDPLERWLADLAPWLPHVDILFATADEARRSTGLDDPAEAAAEFRRLGARTVVVKLGGEGCAVYSEDGVIRSPAFEVSAVDTTGAGDCFAGGYVAALHHGCSHAEAARVANAVGALSVQRIGSTDGLLAWEETIEWMNARRT